MSARVCPEAHRRSATGPVAGGWLVAILAAVALCGALFGSATTGDAGEPAALAIKKVSAL